MNRVEDSYMTNINVEYALQLNGITKIFPGVKALDNVTIGIKKGEVHALVGENGAGKSTLINIISGVLQPDEGQVFVNGKQAVISSPKKSFDLGIGVVHQERNLIDTFNVAQNICFNDIALSMTGIVNMRAMNEKAKKALDRIQLELSAEETLDNLSSGKKQMLEIARALSMDSSLLLLDEPTASISLMEADILLETVEQLREEGVSIIYVSHKLEEIFRIADRITVIRDGKKVGDTIDKKDINREGLIEMMVGRKQSETVFPLRNMEDVPVILNAEAISSKHNPKPKSFKLKHGEILGWYGLVGSGRTELAREVIGIDPIKNGSLYIHGKKVNIKNYTQAFEKHSLYYISENRKEEGLFLQHKISTNISIVVLKNIINKFKFISYQKENETAEYYKRKLNIKTDNIFRNVVNLSGGNQQKVCIAKGLATAPEIIIIDEPTVGIDVNTKTEIHKLIYKLSQQGMSIIIISSDLPELLLLADRVMVFKDNEIRGELDNVKDYQSMSNKVMSKILM